MTKPSNSAPRKGVSRGPARAGRQGLDHFEEKPLQDEIYNLARNAGIEPKAFFEVVYRVLIGKTQGSRLAGFIKTLGKDHILAMLCQILSYLRVVYELTDTKSKSRAGH